VAGLADRAVVVRRGADLAVALAAVPGAELGAQVDDGEADVVAAQRRCQRLGQRDQPGQVGAVAVDEEGLDRRRPG
jgi:hypothetical protein